MQDLMEPGQWFEEISSGSMTQRGSAHLRAYYSRKLGSPGETLFTGEYFDLWGKDPSPNAFTAEDIIAVSCLSVNIPATVSIKLLQPGSFRNTVGGLLSMTSFEEHLEDAPRPSPESPLWRLDTLLRKETHVGAVKASKLIARKRPHWNAIYDVRVKRMLSEGGRVLVPVWEAMQDSHFVASLNDMRTAAGLPDSLSLLRVFDVVTWMEAGEKGW